MRSPGVVVYLQVLSVARIWRRHGLQPHRLRHFMASNDPAFEAEAADMIGLYLAPPAHAAVFCVDEKSAIQALDRLDPVLPLSPGAERHGFEYFRHGTLSLYAALETKSGQVIASTASRHTSQEFVRFAQEVVATQPSDKEIHLIVDNLSAHKTKLVDRFLADHPNVSLHYTPTYSSWLNQVENWFSKVQRHVIARGIFESVTDLRRKLMRYMARSLRVEYVGAYYHVMARGNRREEIFMDEEDRRFFLEAMAEVCAQTRWRVHAWVMMGNHYHLFIETAEASLVGKNRGVLRWLAARLKMRSAANVSQTLRRTEWKSLLKRLPRTLAE